ncbi:MAG: M20/M25/M40 family metallo-hydrolase, partial [Bacteroides sp.]|nr:M20/M25/M40 family metallo-hydrolase [Bacteroides sp.]
YKIKYGEASEGSHGAIDDGYGVAVLLELARIYADEKLTNGIKFAFTDCEEEGCIGSEALVEEYGDWLKDVNLVINVESRGETGPVYLFQTSDNNTKLIEFYKNAGFPYTFSVAAEIYNMMPNDTDLSPFIEGGYNGLNVASLDGIKNYHNDGDKFENADENTLVKYCDTLLPLLDEYTKNSRYSDIDCFDASTNSLFFTLFPNALVSYNEVTGWVFFGITTALVIALVAILVWKKKISIKKVLISLGIDLGLLAVICGLGFLIAAIACAICGVSFHFMFVIAVSSDAAILIIFSIVSVLLTVLSTLVKSKFFGGLEMTVGALIFHVILSVVSAAVLFGGSFIFVIPSLLVAIAAFLTLLKNRKLKTYLVGGIMAIAMIFTLSFYVSLIYSVYVSLSFGAFGLLIALPVIPLELLLPQAFDFYSEEVTA